MITFGWGIAVMAGVFAVGQFSGAHLNPAVTLGFAIDGSIEWATCREYFAGEFVGAFIGATLVWLAYLDHWKRTEDPGVKLAVLCTGPAIRNPVANVVTEVIGTFVLVFVILAFFADEKTAATGSARCSWACWWSVSACHSAVRPATRSIPRVISGRGSRTRSCRSPARATADWGYAWIPVVAPLIGGALAAVFKARVP